MRYWGLAIASAVVVTLFLCHDSFADIGPSFMLDHCTWHASDIVVATQDAAADGTLTVLDTWKGSLKKGDNLTIPELKGYASEVSKPFLGDKEPPTKAVTGQRMILFLVRATRTSEAASRPRSTPTEPEPQWESASIFSEMNVSVVWVEQGQVYNFSQVINPGPSLLIARGETEEQFKKKVDVILADQAKVHKALSIKSPSERAAPLKPMVASTSVYMRQAALDGMAACGKDGLPALREMLLGAAIDQRTLIEALVKAGGKECGAEITAILKQDLEYWRKLAPSLQVGWWNGTGLKPEEVNRYQNRYGRVYACLFSLRTLKYKDAAETVTALRDFWRSLPQLNDKSGLIQISEECNEVLKALGSEDTP